MRSCFNERIKQNLINFLNELKTKKIEFQANNFDEFNFSILKETDFVYADPPYLITTGTYNDGKRGFTGWNKNQEQKLLETLKNLDSKNIKFALSNVLVHKGKENELLKTWIKENNFYVHYLNKNYSNSNYHTLDRNKNSTTEVLITNYKKEEINENLIVKFA